MPLHAKSAFPHRHNRNGSHDAICTVCLATVASAINEGELARHEVIHVCDPMRLSQLARRSPGNFFPSPDWPDQAVITGV